jgi:hypothetical protein
MSILTNSSRSLGKGEVRHWPSTLSSTLHLVPDLYPKFASNVKLSSPRMFSSPCGDPVATGLIFCCKLGIIKLSFFLADIGPFECYLVMYLSRCCTFKSVIKMILYACIGLLLLSHMASTRSETLHQLSQH